MQTNVINNYQWRPDYVHNMYLDAIDIFGLVYWHQEAQRQSAEAKKSEK